MNYYNNSIQMLLLKNRQYQLKIKIILWTTMSEPQSWDYATLTTSNPFMNTHGRPPRDMEDIY